MTKQSSNQLDLFNMLFRHQIYIEGVRMGFVSNYRSVLRKLYREFGLLFLTLPTGKLDDLTRSQLQAFVRKFALVQEEIQNEYALELESNLQDFTDADVEVSNAIFEKQTGFSKLVNIVKIWTDATKEPIPANGALLLAYITAFLNSATQSVASLLRQGYANGWTTQETLSAIVGTQSNRFQDGLFRKLDVQSSAMSNTIVQHVSSTVQSEIAKSYFDEYYWIAILDDRTTLICRSRNGNVYIYGEGPLPPAHYNCRSKAVPKTGDDAEFQVPALREWFKDQPDAFKEDVLGTTAVDGTDLSIAGIGKPLTVEQFRNKTSFIIGE